MHPRFARAPTLHLSTATSSLDLVVANSARLRLLGLMGIEEDEFVPLLFPRCRSLHTYWMKAPIDVVWLELRLNQAEVVATAPQTETRRRVKLPGAARPGSRRSVAALELRAGAAHELELFEGDRITLGRTASAGF